MIKHDSDPDRVENAPAVIDVPLLRAILDGMAEAVVVCNANLELTYCNNSAKGLFGVSLSGPADKDWARHCRFLQRDGVTPCPIEQIPFVRASRGESHHVELYVMRPDGSGVPVEANGRPLRDESGRIAGGIAVFTDITSRKRIEEILQKSEARLQTVLDHMPAMIAYWNADLCNEFGNRAYEDWFGVSPKQMHGRHIRDVIGDDLYVLNKPYMDAALRGEPQLFERAIKDSKGEERYTQASYVPDISDGIVKGIFVLVTDITQRRQMEVALQASEERFRDMASNVPGVVYQYLFRPDRPGRYLYVSAKIKDILGIEPELLMADPSRWLELIHPNERESYWAGLARDSAQLANRNWEGRLLMPDGTVRWVNVTATPRYLAEGAVLWNGLMLDITERKRAELALKHRANTDHLTGVASRGYFLTRAAQEIARARRYGSPLALAMIDLDHFKNINDAYGHQFGDVVLKELAAICRRELRAVDLIGRLGGEEFVVLLPETALKRALDVAERLRQAINAREVPREQGAAVHFTASIGIATLDADTDIDALLSRADKALYNAKQSGRNRVCGG